MSVERQWNILVGATGSVASIKIPNIKPGINVKVVPTNAAHFFFKDLEVDAQVHTDAEEWDLWKQKTDPVLHIELRKWADIMVIAPLDANTLAKIASGLCDNLLTCVLRAWDTTKPVVVCPAMNTHMWTHPFTAKHLSVLEDDFRFKIVAPISKLLACGDTGVGGMAEPETIASKVFETLSEIKIQESVEKKLPEGIELN
ncbi:unnamed protein product [Cunninghamella echinulata]